MKEPKNATSPVKINTETLRDIARSLVYDSVNANRQTDKYIAVQYSFAEPTAQILAREVIAALGEAGIPALHIPRDLEADGRYVEAVGHAQLSADEKREAIRKYVFQGMEPMRVADKAVIIRESMSLNLGDDPVASKAYQQATREVIEERLRKPWILICPPTEESAQQDNVSLKTALKRWLQASERDWQAVMNAQRILTEEILNPAREITVITTATDHDPLKETDFTVNLEGQTFAKSTTKHNYPGDEVYTGGHNPNGRISFPHRLMFNGIVIPNLSLVFKDGEVIDFAMQHATSEQEAHVKHVLTKIAGANKIGEFAIGTNREILHPTVDTLLNEKALGVHIALGASYEDSNDEAGDPVHINNGNESIVHIDCTLPMGPHNQGKMYADGKLFFANGVFVDAKGNPDSRLAVLSAK